VVGERCNFLLCIRRLVGRQTGERLAVDGFAVPERNLRLDLSGLCRDGIAVGHRFGNRTVADGFLHGVAEYRRRRKLLDPILVRNGR
jgi:hypothetical protein